MASTLPLLLVSLAKAKQAAARGLLAADAVTYCDARSRFDAMKAMAARQPPSHPDLRDEIQRMVKADQEVRQKGGFDPVKMQQVVYERLAIALSPAMCGPAQAK